MRVTPVRRTVAVAVSLVTGQALLCGVIGFVTFGPSGDTAPGATGAAAPQLAGPPLTAPQASVVSPSVSAPPRKGTRKPAVASRSLARQPSPGATRGASKPPIAPSGPAAAPAEPGPPAGTSSPPPDLALLPTSPAPAGDVEAPVVVKDRCDDAGAAGRTADGKAVRCERGPDGDLRWQLV